MHLNNKGFAISGVLYSMLILIVTLMFLILGILAGRRTTLNKISSHFCKCKNSKTPLNYPCFKRDKWIYGVVLLMPIKNMKYFYNSNK